MATLTPINAASPLDTSNDTRAAFAAGSNNSSETLSFALDNVDELFESMTTASWTIEYRQQGRSDDTLTLRLRVMSGATVLAAADAGGTFVTANADVQSATDVTTGPTAFAYVNTTATKTEWDAATVEIQQFYIQNMGPDSAFIEVDWFQLTGTYELAAIPAEPDDADHLHIATSPTVTQIHDVTVDHADHLHTATSPDVSQTHDVAPESAIHLHAATSPTVDITHIVAPLTATHVHTADSPSVTQIHEVQPSGSAHLHVADSPIVTQTHIVAPNDATHLHTADSPTVEVKSIIVPNDTVHLHTADSPTIDQTYKVLQITTAGIARSANFTEEAVGGKLMVLHKDNGVFVRGELVEQDPGVFKLDGTNNQVIAVEFIET